MKKISIIIPAHNEEKYIELTIRSIFASKGFTDFEIIVVCNGCTDNTDQIAKQAGANVVYAPIKGGAEASNYGASIASGDILMFLDADTEIKPNLLYEINIAINDGYIGGRTVVRWNSKSLFGKLAFLISYVHKYKWGGCCFVKKDIFEKIGGYREGFIYGFDFDLGKRVSKKDKVKFIRNSGVLTSDRRYSQEGWLRHLFLASKRYYIDECLLKKGLKKNNDIDYRKID